MRKPGVQASRGRPTAPFIPRDTERPGTGKNCDIYLEAVELQGN